MKQREIKQVADKLQEAVAEAGKLLKELRKEAAALDQFQKPIETAARAMLSAREDNWPLRHVAQLREGDIIHWNGMEERVLCPPIVFTDGTAVLVTDAAARKVQASWVHRVYGNVATVKWPKINKLCCPTWRTGDGRVLYPHEMTTEHLENTIAWIKDNAVRLVDRQVGIVGVMTDEDDLPDGVFNALNVEWSELRSIASNPDRARECVLAQPLVQQMRDELTKRRS